ncbi:hypothetical protein C0J52_22727 [Blattella germanica]|nr:hypothetical protein C0J52_22727 [Blattella germanica]
MYSIDERIAVVSYRLRGMTYDEARDNFTRKFLKPAPTRHAIKNMVNKFKRTGSVADEQRTGRPAVTDETTQRIQEAITRSPSASTRRLRRELDIAHTTVELEEHIENAGYVAYRGIAQNGHANADIIVLIEEISLVPGPSKKKKIEEKKQH